MRAELPANLFHLRQLARALWQVRSDPLFQRSWPRVRKIALGLGLSYWAFELLTRLLLRRNWLAHNLLSAPLENLPLLLLLKVLLPAAILLWVVRWGCERLFHDPQIKVLPIAAETRLAVLLSLVLAGTAAILTTAFLARQAIFLPLSVHSFSRQPRDPLASVALPVAFFLRDLLTFLPALLTTLLVVAVATVLQVSTAARERSPLAEPAALVSVAFLLRQLGADVSDHFAGSLLWFLLNRGVMDPVIPPAIYIVGDAFALMLLPAPFMLIRLTCFLAFLYLGQLIWRRALPRARRAFLTVEPRP